MPNRIPTMNHVQPLASLLMLVPSCFLGFAVSVMRLASTVYIFVKVLQGAALLIELIFAWLIAPANELSR